MECAIESTRVLLVATYWRGSAYKHMFRTTLVAGSLGVLGKADGRFCCPPCRGWVLRKLETSTVSGCIIMYQVYPGMNFPHLLAIFQVWYIIPSRKSQTFGTVLSATRFWGCQVSDPGFGCYSSKDPGPGVPQCPAE